jgi:succinoglycan biosynthesis transport protein ExoP
MSPSYIPEIEDEQRQPRDIRDWFRLLRRRGWILLLCVILIPAAIYLYTSGRPKVFQASTIVSPQSSGTDSTLPIAPEFAAGQSNVQAIASFIGTSAVADEAARQLGLPQGSLLGAAAASADTDTGFVTITTTAATAARAKAQANAFAAALNATRQKRNRQRVGQAIQSVQDTLQHTPKSDTATRTQLRSELQKLQTLQQAQSQNVQVLQPALGASQIAPHPRRNATVGILLALLVGLGLILIAEHMDRRLRKPEDVEKLTGLPFLGTIPHDAFPGEENSRDVHEAFQTLRNSLTYFNAEKTLDSLIVCSGLKGEGKTTVAANLALAYAAFGKRVIALDTDLRKPDLAKRLGFDDRTGLTDVLAGTTTLEDAFIEVPPYGRGLRLLPAGPVPPNPSAMLGSLRMASLIEELVEDADLVILDTAPLLIVSDAFPLLDKVSGVLPLARLDSTPRDAIKRMVQVAASAGARLLGMVATDAKTGSLTGYGYGYGYGGKYGGDAPKKGEKDPTARTEAPRDGDSAPAPVDRAYQES